MSLCDWRTPLGRLWAGVLLLFRVSRITLKTRRVVHGAMFCVPRMCHPFRPYVRMGSLGVCHRFATSVAQRGGLDPVWYADNHGTITCTALKTCPQPLSVHVSLVDKRFEAEDVTLGVALVTVLPTVEVEHGAQPGSTLHELVNVPIALVPPPPPAPRRARQRTSGSGTPQIPAAAGTPEWTPR